jgi:hypothetical protein
VATRRPGAARSSRRLLPAARLLPQLLQSEVPVPAGLLAHEHLAGGASTTAHRSSLAPRPPGGKTARARRVTAQETGQESRALTESASCWPSQPSGCSSSNACSAQSSTTG